MNRTETGRERTVAVEERAAGLSVSQIMLVAVLLAAGTAFCPDGRKHPGLWAALALLLAGLYMLLTFTPPGWGPFVNPLG